jgi:pimeloyl-ACP methyl ester carboxylesterase
MCLATLPFSLPVYQLLLTERRRNNEAKTTISKRRSQVKRLFLPLCLLAFLLSAGVTQAQTYQIISTQSSNVANNLTKTVTTVQVGSNPLNRFLMTRVRKNIPNHALKGTILLLPPLGSGFQNYEVGDGGNYDNSFAGFFDQRNYDVWGYSQRVQGLAAGSCESNVIDCSVMADWGLQTILDDVVFIRQQIEATHPGQKPIVGGLSLGSIASIATINAHPADYAGAILIEGTLYDEDPVVRNINANFCAVFDNLLANGIFSNNHLHEVEHPVLKWLQRVRKQ